MRRFPVRPAAVLISLLLAAPALAPSITAQVDNPAFQRTWERTDRAVADGTVSRTWIWGELVTETTLMEEYAEGPGGQRQVLYYDKARMEDNSWRAPDAPWDVTNGLLVVELATSMLQSGDADFVERAPSDHNVAGDADDPTGPTYTTIAGLMDAPAHPDGATIDWTVVRDGTVGQDPTLGAQNVTAGPLSPETGHRTASVFWDFMNSSGPVWVDEQLVTDTLFPTAYYATGLPITEAYWASVKVAGTYRIVLLQCFERRCLTFTPDNPDGWQTEMGNVGQHYHAWRYTTEQRYEVLFGSLNDSGVTGSAELTLVGNQLTIEFNVSGLEPGQPHAVHVYGNPPESQSHHLQQAGPADCPVQDEDEVVGFEGYRIIDAIDPTSPVPVADEFGNLETAQLPVGIDFSFEEMILGVHGSTVDGQYNRTFPVGCGWIERLGAHEFGDYSQTYLEPLNDSGVEGSLGIWTHGRDEDPISYSTFFDIRATLREESPSGRYWRYSFYGLEEDDRPDCSDPIFDTNGDGEVSDDEAQAYLRAVNAALLFETNSTDEDGNGVREAGGALHVPFDDEGNLAVFIFDGETGQPLGCGTFDLVGPGTQFGAFLAGAEESPPVETSASGLVIFKWLEDNTFSYDLIVTGLDEVTGAHIHTGVFGQNGPVIVPLFTPEEPTGPVNGMLVEDGVIDLNTFGDSRQQHDLFMSLLSQQLYVNVHTSEYPDGALRGNLGVTIPDVYTAGLDGDQVVPPVDTEMSGSVAFLIAPDQSTISFQLIISSGVDVTSAHIHLGEPGEVVVTLYDLATHGPRPGSGVLRQGPITLLEGPLIDESLPTLAERFEFNEVYVDVHTEAHPDGEIRGQPRR